MSTALRRGTDISWAAYWLTIVAVYFLVGVLFFYSGKSKLIDGDGDVPPPLREQFEGTFIDTFPGIDLAWTMLAILEWGVVALMVLSLLRGEFLPLRPKGILLAALGLAMLTFACLSFGQTSTGNNEGTASLFTYFGATAVLFLLVLRLPPNGPGDSLGSRTRV